MGGGCVGRPSVAAGAAGLWSAGRGAKLLCALLSRVCAPTVPGPLASPACAILGGWRRWLVGRWNNPLSTTPWPQVIHRFGICRVASVAVPDRHTVAHERSSARPMRMRPCGRAQQSGSGRTQSRTGSPEAAYVVATYLLRWFSLATTSATPTGRTVVSGSCRVAT